MKKIIWIVVVVVVAVGVWLGVSKKSAPVTEGASIKIGVIAPLTGPLAEYGEAFKNGITMANEKSGSENVQWIFEDSAYDPKKTVSAFYKLRDSDKINFLVNWGDPTSFALAPLMKDESMPFIAVADIPEVADSSKYTVRTLNDPKFFTTALWNYFRTNGMKNIAIVKVENPYLNGMYESLLATKQEGETVTLVDNYQSFGDFDFRTSITKIKNTRSSYDALGVFLASSQIGQFYKQKNDLGLNIQTFGTDFFESQRDIDAAGSAMDGAVYANMNVSDSFKNDYQNKFGNVSQISYAGNGYDTAMILNSLDLSSKDQFLSGIKKINRYSGVSGNIKYVEEGNDRYLYFPVFMKLIKGGKIEVIK